VRRPAKTCRNLRVFRAFWLSGFQVFRFLALQFLSFSDHYSGFQAFRLSKFQNFNHRLFWLSGVTQAFKITGYFGPLTHYSSFRAHGAFRLNNFSQKEKQRICIVIEYGVSGAEKELLRDVRSNGIPAECFRDISEERQRLESEYSEKAGLAEEEILREIEELDAEIGELRQVIEKESCRVSEETRLELVKLEAELKEASKVRPVPGKLISYLLARVKRYLKGRRHARLKAESQKEAGRLLRNEYAALKEVKDRCEYLKNNTVSEIERKLFPLVRQLEALKQIMVSNNYWGAEGELHVIEKLRTLPDEYYLFNDLNLELEEYITFESKKLKSAQVDHLLVGPSGIYVIETKNWSPAYVKKVFKEHSFTPYDQVRRSSYLVYRYLNGLKSGGLLRRGYFKLASREIKVQPVIAIAGSKIPLEKSPVQVLFADSLSSHVLDREVTLSKGDIKKIVKQLEHLLPK